MKHLLITVIVALIVVPAFAARDRDPRRGARRMMILLLVFHLLYVAFVTLVHATSPAPTVQ